MSETPGKNVTVVCDHCGAKVVVALGGEYRCHSCNGCGKKGPLLELVEPAPERHKVLVYALPMWMEDDKENPEGCIIGGFWSWIFHVVPWNGMALQYTGSYWKALWHFLFSPLP
jgi:hypothetical protein